MRDLRRETDLVVDVELADERSEEADADSRRLASCSLFSLASSFSIFYFKLKIIEMMVIHWSYAKSKLQQPFDG